ncbi:hypothetical protein SESBI_24066 [Sesbania bispinosa]|nr:hypothetical protein SESBI_24066 [Sesbania bispinosa]
MNNGHSLRDKLKSSICVCFTGSIHHEPLEHGEGFFHKLHIPRTPLTPSGYSSSSSSWLKKSPTTRSEFNGDPPRFKGRNLRSRMGRKHRQSQSYDFSYDPSSYALNFENDSPPEEFPIKNFSSRLPASPPSSSPINYSDEIQKDSVSYS